MDAAKGSRDRRFPEKRERVSKLGSFAAKILAFGFIYMTERREIVLWLRRS